MPYWDERVAEMAKHFPDVRWDQYHIDILSAHFVLNPDRFDVVVASNLFGDILSDLGPACTGTIGIAPSANINPTREAPSLFEPVHGSAPDISGKGIANPIGQIWCGSMMLDHLGHAEAAADVLGAVDDAGVGGRDRRGGPGWLGPLLGRFGGLLGPPAAPAAGLPPAAPARRATSDRAGGSPPPVTSAPKGSTATPTPASLVPLVAL